MAFPNYAKTRNEKLWVVPETTFNVLAQPDQQHAVIPVEGVDLPQASPEFTPSIERNPSAGVRALIKRKIRPAEWSLPFYAKTAAHAGDQPTYGELLKKGFGLETTSTFAFLETALAGANNDLRFTARVGGTAGNAVTIEYVDPVGNNVPLSVAVVGTAITVTCATDGASAITSTAKQIRDLLRATCRAIPGCSPRRTAGPTTER
jgi:hypothetical protein